MNVTNKITYFRSRWQDLIYKYPDNYFDWAICDPEYGLDSGNVSNRTKTVEQQNGTFLPVNAVQHTKKDWDLKPVDNSYFREIKRVSKKQIIWGANYYDYPLPGGRLIWDKLNGNSDQYDAEIAYLSFTQRVETVYYVWRGMLQGVRASSNVYEGIKIRGNKQLNEVKIHPTQKPVALYLWILQQYVKRGEGILDTHAGSFSLGVAAHMYGCPIIACEKDKEYYESSLHRIMTFVNNTTLFNVNKISIQF